MPLLDDVLDAHGGLAPWRALQRFTLHVSIGGWLVARKGKAGILSEAVAEGSTVTQAVQITTADRIYHYTPDRVAVEGPDGTTIWRDAPQSACLGQPDEPGWDDLDLAYFAGRTLWMQIAMPFLLVEPDVRLETLEPWQERVETWHRLRAGLPPRIATFARDQILHFDEAGLLRRLDYELPGSAPCLAKYVGTYQRFSGITVPTLCRWSRLGPDGKPAREPELVGLEIFDARFD
jgi:hypothetical protein